MNDNKILAHTKWNCKYHIVFAPKYRRKIFYAEQREAIMKIIKELCTWKGIEIIEGEMAIDHIHLLLSIPPKFSIWGVMGYLNFYAQSSPRNLFRVCRQDREWGI